MQLCLETGTRGAIKTAFIRGWEGSFESLASLLHRHHHPVLLPLVFFPPILTEMLQGFSGLSVWLQELGVKCLLSMQFYKTQAMEYWESFEWIRFWELSCCCVAGETWRDERPEEETENLFQNQPADFTDWCSKRKMVTIKINKQVKLQLCGWEHQFSRLLLILFCSGKPCSLCHEWFLKTSCTGTHYVLPALPLERSSSS